MYARVLHVAVVDGFVDVEEEDFSLSAGDEFSLGEIDESSAVDEQEEAEAVVGKRLGDARIELGVLGDGVDLVVYIFALEELLSGKRNTDRILSVHSESTSTPQKTTIDT